MAKLTNKYDVIRMGDTPSFMSGVYDVLEKYLDPEYQMRLRAEKEEQRRYENERAVEADRYNKEFNFKLNEYNDAKQRQDRIDRKNALNDLNNEFYSNITIMRENGASAEAMVDFISGYKNESTTYGDNISIDKIDPLVNSYMDKAQFINNANNFIANPTEEDYNSLITQMGDNPDNISYFESRVKPKYTEFKNNKQTNAIVDVMGSYFDIDPSILSQLKVSGKYGEQGVALLNKIIEDKKLTSEKRIKLGESLLALEAPDDTATDEQRRQYNNMLLLGTQILTDEGILQKKRQQKETSSQLGNVIPFQFNPRTIPNNARVVIRGEELTGKQFKQKYGQANFTDEDLTNMQVFDPTEERMTVSPSISGFGQAVTTKKVPSKTSRKIPTKEQINKTAASMGFDPEKMPKGSIQYRQLKEKLQRMYPSYDFGS